jgi:hypothetical protein
MSSSSIHAAGRHVLSAARHDARSDKTGRGGEPNALARGCCNATRPELTLRRVPAVA